VRTTGLSLRWWLAAAFALVASITALVVAEVFTARAEGAFRARAQELASGTAVVAAESVRRQTGSNGLQASTRSAARSNHLSLFVFNRSGQLLTPTRSRGTQLETVGAWRAAMRSALERRRYVSNEDHGRTIVVGLPLHAGEGAALVAIASRPELRAELGIVRGQVVRAVGIAIAVGAAIGLLISLLIAVRLRRIARAAASIDRGNLETVLRPGFRDEVGELAATVDAMRRRLRDSFGELEKERDRLRRLLERLHEGVVVVDPTRRVQFANGVAATLLGVEELRPGDELPEPWHDLSLREVIDGVLVPGAPVAEARSTFGESRSVSIVALPPAPGTATVILVLRDVTERERQERAEREFVANAAHELRTPLAAIGTAVEALNNGAKNDPAERDRFLDVVDRQTARLGRLARALLVLARAQTREEAVKLEAIELRPLLTEIAAGVQTQEGVALEVDCPDGLTVLAQRDLIEQVISNLAANAVKHTGTGTIILGAAQGEHRAVTVEVSDTGPGIDPAVQSRMYDRFFVADGGSRDGFGLGLAIVRESVRALGGLIEIESRVGAGTTARVTLAEGR
jgi:two-component system sensor histidine kinase VicK